MIRRLLIILSFTLELICVHAQYNVYRIDDYGPNYQDTLYTRNDSVFRNIDGQYAFAYKVKSKYYVPYDRMIGVPSINWNNIQSKPSEYNPSPHLHVTNDVSGLQATLNSKSDASHTHAYGTLIGLPTLFDGTYASLSGKPSTFTPSSHTHAEAEITNLVNDLAGKASSVHSHTINDVTSLQALLDAKSPLISPSFTTPNIGAATGVSFSASGDITSSTGGIGYITGNGGAVTQTGNKGTAVTINKRTGRITIVNATLAAGAEVSFNVNNSTVGANDVPLIAMIGGGTAGAYSIGITAVGAGVFTVTISNLSAGSLSEAIQLNLN